MLSSVTKFTTLVLPLTRGLQTSTAAAGRPIPAARGTWSYIALVSRQNLSSDVFDPTRSGTPQVPSVPLGTSSSLLDGLQKQKSRSKNGMNYGS